VNVTFSPMVTGDATARLSFKASDNTIPPAVVTLVGKGAAAKVSVNPASLDFGTVAVGATSKPQMVTLTNVSMTALKIMSVSSDNPAFAVNGVDTATNVSPSGKSTFNVTFT